MHERSGILKITEKLTGKCQVIRVLYIQNGNRRGKKNAYHMREQIAFSEEGGGIYVVSSKAARELSSVLLS
jgi:hypothetical protein